MLNTYPIACIYLIKKNGRIIGGTSPFTIVYTSPNWNNPNPVRMLQDRTPKFREFMYKFADAYAAAGNVSDLVEYINRCKPFDPQYRMVNFGGQWPIATLATNYPPVQWQGNSVMINNAVETPLYLFAKNQQNFDWLFFLMDFIHQPNEECKLRLRENTVQALRKIGW